MAAAINSTTNVLPPIRDEVILLLGRIIREIILPNVPDLGNVKIVVENVNLRTFYIKNAHKCVDVQDETDSGYEGGRDTEGEDSDEEYSSAREDFEESESEIEIVDYLNTPD
ncbi:hypothetical protein IFR05_007699 [Cadophora sp. M221]|nr:hypothetical protein IFR05_007699 [Cadophora sp. M221]